MKFKLFVLSVSSIGLFFMSTVHADPIEKTSDVISIPKAMQILEKGGYYDFRKIKVVREYNEIEVDALNKDGHRVEIEMDLYTGDIMQEQID
ncbi:PepSY domain-containing protein [Photobacterium angustum]|uniref:PepSY domain-containing protein n=2 Tax=Photobacterium angustum TaxID=661 RepID=A0A855SG49_PHOAN|nr:PepSY domain-containing protein [Photobacterium angustum]KJG27232.1 hypothetical protein UA69_20195 [Photobacterium angustum]KJG49993.1 hypothetical protein UA30_05660 [Photobacterium angustum]KJG53917.1 hypothetical protein UA34_06495 [Photobacterium angustum]PSW91758.1 PepSY domain-containing protein [Photobacterium angustum]PSX08706.1 PepSY domain-containing protein [Photobacterium angustum]